MNEKNFVYNIFFLFEFEKCQVVKTRCSDDRDEKAKHLIKNNIFNNVDKKINQSIWQAANLI